MAYRIWNLFYGYMLILLRQENPPSPLILMLAFFYALPGNDGNE